MHRRVLPCLLTLALACLCPASEIGQEVASQVSLANYQYILEELLYTRQGHNRAFNGAHHDLARNNIVATLQSYGLQVELFPFPYNGGTYYNVIATKTGVLYPDVAFVVGGHYDSVNNAGADDDASGVAATMELARVFSAYDTAYTIKFCAWDVEEQGLVGSRAYVAARRTDAVRNMIQIDMIARDAGLNRQDLYAGPQAAQLRDGLVAAFPLYGNGLGVQTNPHASFSDHAPFYDAGYQAICFVEDAYTSNSCYHQACDYSNQPGYLNYTFATNLVRVIAGYLADNALAMRRDDCNNNGLSDAAEIAAAPALDCNANGVLDACEPGLGTDCNNNGSPDVCDLAAGLATDADHNGVLDECQTTRLVPAQYATIQAAITAAAPGDTVLVAPGTYSGTGNKDLDFGGKALTLRSQDGPATCTINAGGTGRCFLFGSGETRASVVDGFTLTGGSGSGANSANGGGAVICIESSPLLRNCVITGNTSSGGGGGVSLFRRSHATLVNCTIRGNTASGASGAGGGLRASLGSMPTLVNCVIAGNTAGSGGGIECFQTARPTLIHCTLSRNHATNQGGGVFEGPHAATDLSHATLINCVVWGNTSVNQGPNLYVGSTTSISVYSSDVQGGQAAVVGGGTIAAWVGNIDADPLFLDAAAHDYDLAAGSPAIDAGDNTRVPPDFADLDADGNVTEPLSRDRLGRPRFADDPTVADSGIGSAPIVDLGAFERPAPPPCVGDLNGDGAVDLSDLTTLLSHYGTASGASAAEGDLDGDGAVGLSDLAALLSRFGSACP